MPGLIAASAEPPLFWRADPAGRWIWSCAQWTTFTGQPEARSLGDGWLDAVHPDDRPAAEVRWIVGGACGTERAPLRLRRSGGGGYRPVQPRAAHALGPDGLLRGWVGTMLVGPADASGDQRRTDEVQHHMRNALSVIRSVARRTTRTSDSVEHYASHFEGRLDALARVQDAIIRNPAGGVDLEGLVGEEVLAQRALDGVIVVEGPAVRLKACAAEAFGLALHELAVNAVKFGAFASARGAVAVRWSIDRAAPVPVLRFAWRETGIAVASAAPRRRGFGTELIERGLPYDLDAVTRLDFAPGGVICTISMPLTDEMAHRDAS